MILIVILVLGLQILSKQNDDMPEDKSLSSGTSVIWGNMVKFNNYDNALQYAYKREQKISKRETTLNEKSFYFMDEIEVFDEDDEYPQGICFMDEYICISSYSGARDKLGKVKIYDKQTGAYVLTLGLDEKSHLGGVAYDGKYLWICNSSKMAIERIPFHSLKR